MQEYLAWYASLLCKRNINARGKHENSLYAIVHQAFVLNIYILSTVITKYIRRIVRNLYKLIAQNEAASRHVV